MSSLETGVTVANRYFVEQRIGKGGSAEVFRAGDILTGTDVALKILLSSIDPVEWLARFEREIAACSRLEHSHVVRFHDHGRHAGRPFLVMELLEGGSLGRLIERGVALPPRMVIGLLREACAGLAHLHERGLVHRDIKPENIMFDDSGRSRLVDFGLAIDQSGPCDERLTSVGSVVGTPEYLSPEQVFGQPIDGRTDVFALGVTAYEMLTGKLPFDGPAIEIARQNAIEQPPPMRQRNPEVRIDHALQTLVSSMLERCPQNRPTAAEVLAELDRLARPVAAKRRAREPEPARPGWFPVAVAAALGGAALVLRLAPAAFGL